MKHSRITHAAFGLASAIAVTMFSGNVALAGPGSQYWKKEHEKAKARAEVEQVRKAIAVERAEPAAMGCPSCQTKVLEEFSFYNVSGKIAPRSIVVGKRHYCDGCKGVITYYNSGKIVDEMKRTCPNCVKAGASCCVAKH